MNVEPKQNKITKEQIDDMELWLNKFEGDFLKTMKRLLITSPSMILFWFIRFVMLIVFWYAAIYVFANRVYFVLMLRPLFLPFIAIYISVVFNAFYQTLDFVQRFFTDIKLYKEYKKTQKKYETTKARLIKEGKLKKTNG